MKRILILMIFASAVLSAYQVSAAEGDGKLEAAYGTPEIDGVRDEMWDAAPEGGIDLFTMETHTDFLRPTYI